jgi:hypothetical protein
MDRTAADEFEDRIASQQAVVVLVGVVGQDTIHAHADHFQKRVAHVTAVPWVGEAPGHLLREPQLLIQLTKRQ